MNQDYWPEMSEFELRRMPSMSELEAGLPAPTLLPVPVPRCCSVGSASAYWGRPEAILDPAVRQASSNWHEASDEAIERGLLQLRKDLESGEWVSATGYLREKPELDVGLRLVISELMHALGWGAYPATKTPSRLAQFR